MVISFKSKAMDGETFETLGSTPGTVFVTTHISSSEI